MSQRSRFEPWREVIRLLLMTAGALLGALGVIVFLAPFNIAPTGITGMAVILNALSDIPIALTVFVANIPIQFLAYRMLGGWRNVAGTVYVSVLYSVALAVFVPLLPDTALSDDALLNALFGGLLGGFSAGLIYRGGATFGGTSTLARILQIKFGTPLSSTYLYVNVAVIVLAGIFLGWEGALYAAVVLGIEGAASDYMLEGPSVIRTATIITNEPDAVTEVILHRIRRGATGWEATGMYTGQKRHILFVTVARPEVNMLRQLVLEADPHAFVIIGQGHVAYGEGFKRAAQQIQKD